MNKYLSVKEFSKLAGVSEQAVYQRLTSKLKPYVSTVEGKKKIDITALSEVYGVNVDSTFNKGKTKDFKENTQDFNKGELTAEQVLIETLREELSIKNRQIDNLNEAVTKLTEQLGESQRMLFREQELHYLSMGGKTATDEAEPGEADLSSDEPRRADRVSDADLRESVKKKKRGLMGIFKKR